MRSPGRRMAGLAVVLLSATGCSAAANTSGERVVRISIEHSAFIPSRIEVRRGETVRFVLHNGDPIDHEFIIGDEEVQLRHERGTEREHGAIPGEVSVPAGATAQTTYTFSTDEDLIFGCHLPRHYGYGMRGVIEVR